MPDSHDSLDLPADLSAVPRALQWIEALAERRGWTPRATFGLSLSLDEALTNVVSYAFDPPLTEDAPAIRVDCRTDGARIELELRDNGRAYDPTAGDPPPLVACLDEAGVGGHGVRLMRHYLDTLAYRRQDGWNCLTLVMRTA
ncbi:ATP-binding protein [Castellaniella defragrans]|uniref:ATP-binding protein n=1 Tax=Castellaniella defragrans TaxID=75697 RepID=UPI0023F30927|nr:ATP-binding protein [Castellaniella defragrans]